MSALVQSTWCERLEQAVQDRLAQLFAEKPDLLKDLGVRVTVGQGCIWIVDDEEDGRTYDVTVSLRRLGGGE